MKILHIVAGDLSGGAARGAYWLHQGLLDLGVDSKIILSGKSNIDDPSVFALSNNKFNKIKSIFRAQIDPLILRAYKDREANNYSTGLFGLDFTKTDQYKQADIIHLHWINAGFVNIKHLKKINKPIIWTLRDMWPLTGGCHYSLDCERFKVGCGFCPQLGSHSSTDLSRWVYKRKVKYIPKTLIVVGISHWLTNQARQSIIFKDHLCITVSNNINTKEFHKIDKCEAKKILGFATDKKVVLCGSTSIKDFYKGFQKYIDALHYLNKDNIFLCFFGRFDPSLINEFNFEYKSLGYLNDNISLNLVYAAADVFVAPSIQEAFGKTLAEAQCSGTPVVCFDATGPKDIVKHKMTGYKAIPFDAKDLAKGIDWVLNAVNYEELCQNARDKILRDFDSQVIAKKYINLYKKSLK
jgi:glycosyltransferase involved in cell wall biosynthesis